MTRSRGIYLPRNLTADERFDRLVERVPESGCWIWMGPVRPHSNGDYGAFKTPMGRIVSAHRYAYERFVAPIASGLCVDHLCRVTLCVNPDHLEPVTQRENVLRGDAPAAANARRERCIRGHLLSGNNVSIGKRGDRRCKACHNLRTTASYRRRRQPNA